jgi:large subunit ribosomal protein L22e
MALFKKKVQGQQKKLNLKFHIDCAKVVEDKVLIMRDFEKYLKERIKVDGKKGNLGTSVNLSTTNTVLSVTSEIPFSKRYLKYLTKKYLKKVKIAEYLRVVATEKSKYELKYLKIHNDEEGDEE